MCACVYLLCIYVVCGIIDFSIYLMFVLHACVCCMVFVQTCLRMVHVMLCLCLLYVWCMCVFGVSCVWYTVYMLYVCVRIYGTYVSIGVNVFGGGQSETDC